MSTEVALYAGEALEAYAFPGQHPFGGRRLEAFLERVAARGLLARVTCVDAPPAGRAELERFHAASYVEFVAQRSREGVGVLDFGDTPAFPGVYEAAAAVVGAALDATARLAAGTVRRAFVPIGGLHHARRDGAAGFCVFNDVGCVIEALRVEHGVRRVAYVDIDAHHGDGVFYAYEADPEVFVADVHEDGRYLYPGTGGMTETGAGGAVGCKLNVPLLPGSGDAELRSAWARVEPFLDAARPEFVILQCGADGLEGDPLAHLTCTAETHRLVTERLVALAERHAGGRLLALGGGGYDADNVARAWTEVLEALLG